MIWNENEVRSVFKLLDNKTGLNARYCKIVTLNLEKDDRTCAFYSPQYIGSYFGFNFKKINNMPAIFKDVIAMDIIKHEYSHFVLDMFCIRYHLPRDYFDFHGPVFKIVSETFMKSYGSESLNMKKYWREIFKLKSIMTCENITQFRLEDIMLELKKHGFKYRFEYERGGGKNYE